MKRILVTGGDGTLGSEVVNELSRRGQQVRVMSRKARPQQLNPEIDWAQADVISGQGIDQSLQDVGTIVNCLSSPVHNTYETDIQGLKKLLSVAKRMKVRYLVHISIIGIDRIIYPYYQYKLAAELVAIESGIPCLIARSAQFHSFVDFFLSPLRDTAAGEVKIPLQVQFQSISTLDVAKHLAPHIIAAEKVGRLTEFGGPEVLRLGEMAQAWLAAQGIERALAEATDTENALPFFSAFGEGFINGYNTNPDNRIRGQTWQEYLNQKYRLA